MRVHWLGLKATLILQPLLLSSVPFTSTINLHFSFKKCLASKDLFWDSQDRDIENVWFTKSTRIFLLSTGRPNITTFPQLRSAALLNSWIHFRVVTTAGHRSPILSQMNPLYACAFPSQTCSWPKWYENIKTNCHCDNHIRNTRIVILGCLSLTDSTLTEHNFLTPAKFTCIWFRTKRFLLGLVSTKIKYSVTNFGKQPIIWNMITTRHVCPWLGAHS